VQSTVLDTEVVVDKEEEVLEDFVEVVLMLVY
jgi:hypothetical protein